jgi:hypothetical protein
MASWKQGEMLTELEAKIKALERRDLDFLDSGSRVDTSKIS